jgi:hypothetical protein
MRIALATVGLAALVFAGAFTPASAAPLMPLSKSAISALSGNITDVGWRRCWRDRWGVRRCQWCWRDRWGRVRCR